MKRELNLKILPNNYLLKCEKEDNLLEILIKNNIPIEANCAGIGKCGKCKIKLIEGNLSEITSLEKKLLNNTELENNIILACQRKILSDSKLELLSNKVNDRVSKGNIDNKNKNIDSIIESININLSIPSIRDQRSDVDRILDELKKLKNREFRISNSLYKDIGDILVENEYKINLRIFKDEVIKINSYNESEKVYGISIDVGTTSVALYLVNLYDGNLLDSIAAENPQKKHGADIISRINYAIKSKENKEILRLEIISLINSLSKELISRNNIDKKYIDIVSIVGNTTMSHLLIGSSVEGISRAPFNPIFLDKIEGNIIELGINELDINTKFIVLPNIGGYVGSDTLGAIIGSDMNEIEGNILLIDLGTNCEIALKTNNKILVASTAAGPAFEGSNMKCGIRAQLGAICGCNIDIKNDIDLDIIGDSKYATGVCGSGYINILSEFINKKIISKKGRFVNFDKLDDEVSQNIKNRIMKKDNFYEFVFFEDENNIVSVSQEDITNLQLAKGAVRTAIELIFMEASIEKIDKLLIAGAFGSNLNKESIKNIKMIPNLEDNNIYMVGNAAGKGAIQVLLYKDKYNYMCDIYKKIEHVELANHKKFNRIFATSLAF